MERAESGLPPDVSEGAIPVKRRVFLVGLFATLLGAFVRLAPALASDFPVNDGGLFYVFVQEIQTAHYHLPLYSSYNQAAIPFLYPPLSFYLAGLLSSLTGTSLLDLIRYLPPLVSILTIPAFYLLARKLMKLELAAAAAVVSFALLPTAFDFMVVGGGLPRAFGFLFCILTLYQAAQLYSTGRRSRLIATAVFASLTVLSHPVVAWFMLYSLAILFVFLGRGRRAFLNSLAVGAAVLLLTSPWWGICIARHGLEPFLSAFQAGTRSWSAILAPFLFLQTNEPYLTLHAVFALLGLFMSLRGRRYLLPAWLAAVFLFETRLTATYAAVPTALLAGIGFGDVILRGLASVERSPTEGDPGSTSDLSPASTRRAPAIPTAGGWVVLLATGYFLVYMLIAAFLAAPREALSQSQRQAMQWIRSATPAGSQFAVVSGIRLAGIDYVSEWFPALTDRVSLATPQGYEWFPGQVFDSRWDFHADLQDCVHREVRCLEDWAARAQTAYTHVYLAKDSSFVGDTGEPEGLYRSLLSSPDYEVIYNQENVAIFAHHPTPSPSP
jgi:hypothetical protein